MNAWISLESGIAAQVPTDRALQGLREQVFI